MPIVSAGSDGQAGLQESSLGRLLPHPGLQDRQGYGQVARRERLVSDIPPDTRQERGDRLR